MSIKVYVQNRLALLAAAAGCVVMAACSTGGSAGPPQTRERSSPAGVRLHGTILYIDRNAFAHPCQSRAPWRVDVKDGSGKVLIVTTASIRPGEGRCHAEYAATVPKSPVYTIGMEDTARFTWSHVFPPLTVNAGDLRGGKLPVWRAVGY